MPSPFDLRVYTNMPSWVVAVGIKNDVQVKDSGRYWNLVTATANGVGFALSLPKSLVSHDGKPKVYQRAGLIEFKFNTIDEAADWVAEMKDGDMVEMIYVKNKPGDELVPNYTAKARTCCDSFENEIHKNPCKDYVVTKGVVHTIEHHAGTIKPPVAKAEPGANLCSICWNHYYGTCTGRPCGDCRP